MTHRRGYRNPFGKILLLLVCIASLNFSAFATENLKAEDKEPWQSLFDGKSLKGWTNRGGKAPYRVEGEEIVGVATLGEPNSFLCTEKIFGDFILELEFKVDGALNSGVQFRSSSIPEYKNWRVHGYQVEIDPGQRAWTGGIYDEARRGWLHPLDNNPEGRRAFRSNEWNTLRLEAIGDKIKTWINGIPTAYLIDDQSWEGFIALQVHSISEKAKGTTVRWRNIRIITDNPSNYAKQTSLSPKSMLNKLTSNEEKAGWKLLFDGQSSKGWRGSKIDGFPQQGWEIKDGALTVLASDGKDGGGGGHIVTTEKFSKFELCVDFMLTPGGNSGIKYYVDTDQKRKDQPIRALEYQILDDLLHPDAKKGAHTGSRTAGSLYDLIAPNENKILRPVGEWNHAKIFSNGKRIEHWLNGRKVLEYDRSSDEFRKLVGESKFKDDTNFGRIESGAILLQDHGNRVSFRNIRIHPLK
jgi:hypothetical protein